MPCYNEANRLYSGAFLDYLREHPDRSLHFVDDGSADDTPNVLKAIEAELPDRITVQILDQNKGKAEAVRCGMRAAAASGASSYIAFLDADLSAPLQVIDELVAAIAPREHLHCAFGSRVKRMGAEIERNWMRHYLGRVFATVATTVLGVVAYDSQCGAKLFRASVVDQLFDRPFVSNWFFDLEIILRAEPKSILEVPISAWREVGESKIKWTDFMKAPFELLRIRRHYK